MTGLIIMLCRNALPLSKRCLDTLLAQTAKPNILVIDNASTDATPQWLRATADKHSFYRMTLMPVTSVARCWNEGLRWAWEMGFNEALVVNSDTELLPDTYQQLHDYFALQRVRSDRKTAMVTAVGVDKDPAYPGDINERPHPDYSCFMIDRRAHQLVPFDEGYEGAYFEDADHHVRLVRAGWHACSINLGFKHVSSGTLKHAQPQEQARINRHYAENKQRFLAEYGCVPGSKAYERLFWSRMSCQNFLSSPITATRC